jgi:hypothetical protein
VSDKRLLIVEEEFGRILIVSARTGNTISPTLRYAWDAKQRLKNESKLNPEYATGAHISLIGHITLMELLECLAAVENKNGFSNRILWIVSQRTGLVACPKWIDWDREHPGIVERLRTIVGHFNGINRELLWSKSGEKGWRDFYRSIPDVDTGIVGSIIARSDAHTLRLTMAYTVLDDVTLMQPKHLEAAIAFWDYSQRSAQWAFGEKTGNKTADRIFWALERSPQGMTKSQIQEDVFARNCSKVTLDAALTALVDAGLASFAIEPNKKGGRKPVERWFAKTEVTS